MAKVMPDFYVHWNGSRWIVRRRGYKDESFQTQQAAIDWSKAKAGIDLDHLDKPYADVFWEDREGNRQGCVRYRRPGPRSWWRRLWQPTNVSGSPL